jgi:glycolate oxidase
MSSAASFLTNREIINAARAAMTDSAWDLLVGAAESETTSRRNRLSLDCIAFRPRVLVGVNDVDTSTTFLGQPLRVPVLLANLGDVAAFARCAANDVTEAASRFGSIPFLKSAPDAPTSAPRILELSAHDNVAAVDKAAEAGWTAVCLDLVPPTGRLERVRVTASPMPRSLRDVWRSLDDVVGRTVLPVIVKGVTNADDARLAVEHGVAAIYVSNHGGRALDHCEATIDVLTEVVSAAGGTEVIVDGAFMRGTDVAKALALGARAVAIGRLQGFGLAAAGADGLVRVLEILADELRIALSLLGVTTVSALDNSHLFLDAPPVQLPHETSAFFRTAAAVGPGVP